MYSFQIGDDRTPVCTTKQQRCYWLRSFEFRERIAKSDPLDAPCGCMPACTEIAYTAELESSKNEE